MRSSVLLTSGSMSCMYSSCTYIACHSPATRTQACDDCQSWQDAELFNIW